MPHYSPRRVSRALPLVLLALLCSVFACHRARSAADAGSPAQPGAAAPVDIKTYPRAPQPDAAGLAPAVPAPALRVLPPVASPPNALAQSEPNLPLGNIRLRPGFSIGVYAYPVPSARELCLGPVDAQGHATVYVGSNSAGSVYALRDVDGNGRADEVLTVARGLKLPVGVAYNPADGALYVSAVSRIVKLPQIEARLEDPPAPVLVSAAFPTDDAHGWKFIAFGPDGKLYVPVGAPGNIVDKPDPYASIMRMDSDGQNLEMWARGIRNTVGFAWHPLTHELYFTDNGRDWLGDDWPPDELNHRAPTSPGAALPHFGYPFIQGGYIVDPDYGAGHTPEQFTAPLQNLGAHVAALGMRFYTGSMFPAEYKNAILIAEHGSWNRSTKNGYRISMVRLDAQGKSRGYALFADGWLQPGDQVWGRPDDVLVMPDGSLLISDDLAGAVYRVTYRGK